MASLAIYIKIFFSKYDFAMKLYFLWLKEKITPKLVQGKRKGISPKLVEGKARPIYKYFKSNNFLSMKWILSGT